MLALLCIAILLAFVIVLLWLTKRAAEEGDAFRD